jgi:hypothetical protein
MCGEAQPGSVDVQGREHDRTDQRARGGPARPPRDLPMAAVTMALACPDKFPRCLPDAAP